MIESDIDMFVGPGSTFRRLQKVPKGTRVAASNMPTEGFHKIRLWDGTVGWVAADGLTMKEFDRSPESEGMGGVGGGAKKPKDTPLNGARYRVSVLGGMNLFQQTLTNPQITGVKNGLGFGVEFTYLVIPRVEAAVRLEYLFKNVVVDYWSAIYRMSYSSLPVMAGGRYRLIDTQRYLLAAGAYLGIGLGTKLTSLAVGHSEPAVTEFSGLAFAGLAKVDFGVRITPALSAFVETGYRLLQTGKVAPPAVANGSEIFQSNGRVAAMALNMNGLIFGGGVSLSF